MWFESDYHAFAATIGSERFYPLNNSAMPLMYTIKSANGNHRIPEIRQLAELCVDLHDLLVAANLGYSEG